MTLTMSATDMLAEARTALMWAQITRHCSSAVPGTVPSTDSGICPLTSNQRLGCETSSPWV